MRKNIHLFLSLTFLIAFFIVLIGIGSFKVDSNINSYFLANQNTFFLFFSQIFAFIFDTAIMIIIFLVIVGILLFYKYKREAFLLAFLGISDGILVYLFKHIIQRVRPENLIESGFSFPSGHATISIVFIGFIIYFVARYLKNNYLKYSFYVLLSIIFLLVGFSRIYLGVHWFTDVLGGYFLGGFILFAGLWLSERFSKDIFN